MEDDFFKKLIPTPSITFKHVGRCIYCGSKEDLTKEHIIPFALNGTMILPKSSCRKCAAITTKFERTVTQDMYGNLRMSRDYKTRRRHERPIHLPLSYIAPDGTNKTIDLKLADYPSTYIVAFLPPPGILTGAPLTDMNPEMKVYLRGNKNELEHATSLIGSENIALGLTGLFVWADFFRLLAKIAHGTLVAFCGQEGYVPLLPDLILGRSNYLAHYVGGLGGEAEVHMFSHHVSLVCLPVDDEYYLVAYIHLMGGITMPTYQVIAAKVTNFNLLTDITRSPCRAQ